jgi:hypothetical protein
VIPGFLRRQEVSIQPLAGNQGDGPVYGTAVSYQASVMSMVRRDKAPGGRAACTTYAILLPRDAAVAIGSLATIEGVAAVVTEVGNPQGPMGGHLEVKASTAS